MNQIRFLEDTERVAKKEITVELSNKRKLAFDVDVNYFTDLAMMHLVDKIEKCEIKKSVRFLATHQNKIAEIMSEQFIIALETIANTINKDEDSIKLIELINMFNLEAYILSITSEIVTENVLKLR